MIGALGRKIASVLLPSEPAVTEVHQRLEVTLVRELEAAYAAGTAPAPVAHARGYQWANACHDLFAAGRIDIVEYAARYLHPLYPELTYLATLVALFDAMPRRPPGPLAFRNEPAEEIQIVRRPDCDTAMLCFCAADGNLGLPANFIHQWLGRLSASLVYIKDLRSFRGSCGFPTLGPDRAASVAGFRRIADAIGGKKIFTFGVSRGGYPALYYGLELGAASVLSLAGATDYTREFIETLGPVPRSYLNLAERAPDYFRNLRAVCAATPKTRVLIAYGAGDPRDRRQAERIAGLPNVELIPLDYAQHNIIEPLIRQKEFLPLLQRFLSRP